MENNVHITIGWLYPDLMSTYGDRGNVIVMKNRALWRGISVDVKSIMVDTPAEEIERCDILFMGGAQDLQQEIVTKDLEESKGKFLKAAIDKGIPGLFICGGFQFLGNYYKAADGTIIPGLSIFDLYTEHPGDQKQRCIGNIVVQPTFGEFTQKDIQFVGFENHGGRTYLSDKNYAWGNVIHGFGNNGEDGTEGILYHNAFGTYLHGPILPKNPELADYLLSKALELKYGKTIELTPLENLLEEKGRNIIIRKIENRLSN